MLPKPIYSCRYSNGRQWRELIVEVAVYRSHFAALDLATRAVHASVALLKLIIFIHLAVRRVCLTKLVAQDSSTVVKALILEYLTRLVFN